MSFTNAYSIYNKYIAYELNFHNVFIMYNTINIKIKNHNA